MPTKALLVLAAAVVAIAVPARATADYSLLDFQSAVDALNAVDPTIGQNPADAGHVRFVVGGLEKQMDILKLIGHLSLDVEQPAK